MMMMMMMMMMIVIVKKRRYNSVKNTVCKTSHHLATTSCLPALLRALLDTLFHLHCFFCMPCSQLLDVSHPRFVLVLSYPSWVVGSL